MNIENDIVGLFQHKRTNRVTHLARDSQAAAQGTKVMNSIEKVTFFTYLNLGHDFRVDSRKSRNLWYGRRG